jgi:hypothetical protein
MVVSVIVNSSDDHVQTCLDAQLDSINNIKTLLNIIMLICISFKRF